MRKLARLVLFFTATYVLSLSAIIGFRCLLAWIETACSIPALPFVPLAALLDAVHTAIPAAVYITIMLSLSYAARKAVPVIMTMAALFALTLGMSLGLSLVYARLVPLAVPVTGTAAGAAPATLGTSGLRLRQGDVSIIVLGDPADGMSPRIAAVPGEPMVYMAAPRQIRNTPPRLPPAPFYRERNVIVSSLFTDFTLIAEQFDARLNMGLLPFIVYLGSLCLLLVSFYQIFELTAWPLANMFLGAAIFRGLLTLETFIDSDAIQGFIYFFLGRLIPRSIISPVIFTLLGALILLYTVLINAGKGRRRRRRG